MNEDRLRRLASRHQVGAPSRCCSHDSRLPDCDAASLSAEMARHRAWIDFAYDLLDAHIWGFGPGDWQASEALAHALVGSDWPPAWARDEEDPAHIIVDKTQWPMESR